MPLRRLAIRSITAQFLKPCLPLRAERVTRHAMLLLAAAAIASALPQNAPGASAPPVVQARATVRIVSGVRIQWERQASAGDIPPARTTVVQTVNGPQPAKLIEFE